MGSEMCIRDRDDRINRQELSINRDYFLPGSNILAVEDNTFGAF